MEFTSKELRRYSRFLYLHIHRYDFGYKSPGEQIFRIPKSALQAAKRKESYRCLTKLAEKHLQRHLSKTSTYYYTGQRKTPFLLLCVDVDAHEGQTDAWDVARFLQGSWVPESYAEPSTNGAGVHLFFRLDLSAYPYISNKKLHELMADLGHRLRASVVQQGYASDVCGIYGLPSNWKSGVQAQIIKIPRPQTSDQMSQLLSLQPVSLDALRDVVLENERQSLSHDQSLPTFASSSSSPISTMIATDKGAVVNGHPLPEHVEKADLNEIRGRNPLYRASWTVRTLANILNRTPAVEEALNFYDELKLGTGELTPRRVRRFTQAVEYNRTRFDPSKRRSFTRMYPVLMQIIEGAVRSHPEVTLTFVSRRDREPLSVSLENLCVAYYFALYQLGRDPDGTLPKDGIPRLNKRLLEAKAVVGTISNQKASAARRMLVELGLLELVDNEYRWGHGRGRAKRYRLTPPVGGKDPSQ